MNIYSCTYDVKDAHETKTEKKTEESSEKVFTTDPEIKQIKPKKPVRIKLRRTVAGEYTWTLTGDNVDEVLRVDTLLRKRLKME